MKCPSCKQEAWNTLGAIKGTSWTLVCPRCEARMEIDWLGAALFFLALSWALFHVFFITPWMYDNLPTWRMFDRGRAILQPHYFFIWVSLLMLPPGFILAAMFRFGYKMTRRGNNDKPHHRTSIMEMGISQSRENLKVYYNAKLLGVLLVIVMMAIIAIYFEYIEPYFSNH